MKYIIAVIKPHRLDDVQEALVGLGVTGVTVSDVRGYGRQRGLTEIYRGTEYTISFVPKVKLEIAVDDKLSSRVVKTIRDVANTDKIGDGKIFVLDLKEALRVRTNEKNEKALK
jgi:nitrogen regulatory protein PII